jgi:hypothetical protein
MTAVGVGVATPRVALPATVAGCGEGRDWPFNELADVATHATKAAVRPKAVARRFMLLRDPD